MVIIVGLGNPTEKYKNNYHNMGYRVIDEMCRQLGKSCIRADCFALTVVFNRRGERVVLAKPITFMNNSGQAVKSLLAKYKALPSELIVAYDDIDIPRFSVRARKRGSAGSHNGMRNIVEMIGSEDFMRVRVGIGKNYSGDLADYVLSDVSPFDEQHFNENITKIAEKLIEYLSDGDFDSVMRVLNVLE